jgi:hypothetical protein
MHFPREWLRDSDLHEGREGHGPEQRGCRAGLLTVVDLILWVTRGAGLRGFGVDNQNDRPACGNQIIISRMFVRIATTATATTTTTTTMTTSITHDLDHSSNTRTRSLATLGYSSAYLSAECTVIKREASSFRLSALNFNPLSLMPSPSPSPSPVGLCPSSRGWPRLVLHLKT